MKPSFAPSGAVLLLALLFSGCETDGGASARRNEKAATYDSLKMWQKTLIDEGAISQGFTPDMVYLAMGKPTKIEAKEFPQGHVELWTYSQYYPHVDAVHGFRHAAFSTESAYQPQRALTVAASAPGPGMTGIKPGPPVGQLMQGLEASIFTTAGPQGGNMEAANLRSYTIKVLFASGKVVQIGADENMN